MQKKYKENWKENYPYKIGDRVSHESSGTIGVVIDLHPYGEKTDIFPLIKTDDGSMCIVSPDSLKKEK